VKLSLSDKVVALHGLLDRAGVGHAFGGAISLAYYSADPRATDDIDVAVFLPASDAPDVLGVLAAAGIASEHRHEQPAGAAGVRLTWQDTPVDLFFDAWPVSDLLAQHVRHVPFGDATVPIISPEHLVFFKVMFNRPQDWVDVDAVRRAQPNLDRRAIRHLLYEVLRPSDARRMRFDRLFAS
jgi:hypothetical protein